MKLFAWLLILFAGLPLPIGAQDIFLRPATNSFTPLVAETTVQTVSEDNAFSDGVVRVFAVQDTFIAFSSTPGGITVFSTNGLLLRANRPEFLRIGAGEFIAVKASDTGGMVYIQEMTR